MNYSYGNSWYQPQYTQPQTPQPQPVSSNGPIWVQGEVGARSWFCPAGQSAVLFDSESSVFYIKTVDSSGMPQPLRTFDYSERTNKLATAPELPASNDKNVDLSEYVTKDELKKFCASFVTKEDIGG